MGEGVLEDELPCEPAGQGEIATGSVPSCSSLWRTFARSVVAMYWIKDGYRLLLTILAPHQMEMESSSSSLEHRQFVTNAVVKMVTRKAITMLSLGESPWVLSLLGVVLKRGTDKFRLTVNMRYVSRHIGQKPPS